MSEDICRNNHGGNPESEAANEGTSKSRDRQRIIDRLSMVGLSGDTCDNIEVVLGMSHQTASARCSELRRDGTAIPKPSGNGKYERRQTRTGSTAAVLVLAALFPKSKPEQMSLIS